MSAEAQAVIEKIKAKIAAADPNPANRKVLVVFNVNITSGGKTVKQYTADLKKLELYEGAYAGTADVTITVDDAAMVAIAKKELSQAEAKSQGKLTIEGDADAISKIDLLDLKLGLKA